MIATETVELASDSSSSVTAGVKSIARKTPFPLRGSGASSSVPTLSQLVSASDRGAILPIAYSTACRVVCLLEALEADISGELSAAPAFEGSGIRGSSPLVLIIPENRLDMLVLQYLRRGGVLEY